MQHLLIKSCASRLITLVPSCYNTCTSFLRHKEPSPIKSYSQPRCSSSLSPSSPSLLEPSLLPRRDRPLMPTCKNCKSSVLPSHVLTTCAVLPSSRFSRLLFLPLLPSSSSPTLLVSTLPSHLNWPPARLPLGSPAFPPMSSHTLPVLPRLPLQPARPLQTPLLLLLLLSHLPQ